MHFLFFFVYAVICAVLIIVVIWNNIFGIKDSNFLKFFLIFSICFLSFLYLKRLLKIDEQFLAMSVQDNLAYKYYCEKIMPDIVRYISLNVEQGSNGEDVTFREIKDYFRK